MTADLERLAVVLDGELRSGCAIRSSRAASTSCCASRPAMSRPAHRCCGWSPRFPRPATARSTSRSAVVGCAARRRRSRTSKAAPHSLRSHARPRRLRAPASAPQPPTTPGPRGATPRRKTRSPRLPAIRSPRARPPSSGRSPAPGRGSAPPTLKRIERLGLNTVGDALRHYPAPLPRLLRDRADYLAAHRRGADGARHGPTAPARCGWAAAAACRSARRQSATRPARDCASSGSTSRGSPRSCRRARRSRSPARSRPTAAVLRSTIPAFEKLGGEQRETGRLVPVYPSTTGLAQRTLRTTIAGLLDRFAERLPETLPPELRRAKHDLPGIVEATRQIHYPDSRAELDDCAAADRLRRAARNPARRGAAQTGGGARWATRPSLPGARRSTRSSRRCRSS